MIVSKLELKPEFQPYVLQLEITSKHQENLIRSLFATNIRVPDCLVREHVIRAKDRDELADLMQHVVDGMNKGHRSKSRPNTSLNFLK